MMTWKRLLRDGSIIALLSAIFYFSAGAFEKIRKSEDRAFSADRKLAEKYFADREWERASVHFAKLTDDDRFNGYAWFHQAICHLSLRNQIEDDLATLKTAGADQKDLDALRDKKNTVEQQAITCFQQSSQFLRHRRRALVNLAVVYTGREDWDNAFKYLKTYLDEGNMLIRSLDNITSLGFGGRAMIGRDPLTNPDAKLHRFQEFWDLVDREREIRGLNDGVVPKSSRQ